MMTRLAFSLSVAMAITACTPAKEEKDGAGPSPLMPGFELAVASDVSSSEVPTASVIDLSIEDVAERIERGNVRLIDVRTDEEVAEGMIPGADHIPLDEFDPASLDAADGRDVVLYCRSGRRSSVAAERLARHTGKPAEHLAGGILAWQEAGQPISAP